MHDSAWVKQIFVTLDYLRLTLDSLIQLESQSAHYVLLFFLQLQTKFAPPRNRHPWGLDCLPPSY